MKGQNPGIYILLYVASVLLIYFIFKLNSLFESTLVSALILAIFMPLLFYFLNLSPKKMPELGQSRYTMKCNSCNWEWMSNVSLKAPDYCPKCHKNKVEVLGWRKIRTLPAKNNKDLREFFK